jgi:hypothetical protein
MTFGERQLILWRVKGYLKKECEELRTGNAYTLAARIQNLHAKS